MPLLEFDAKEQQLVTLAEDFVGLHEIGNSNRSPMIDLWQRKLFNAEGWPWCLVFVQALVRMVDRQYDASHLMCSTFRHGLPETAHVMTLWDHLKDYALPSPRPGSLWILNRIGTDSGHVRVVKGYMGGGSIEAIEGNSNAAGSRNGGEVTMGPRSYNGTGALKTMGFVPVWR